MKKLFALIFGFIISIFLLLIFEWIIRFTMPEIKPYGTEQSLISDSVFYESPGLKAGAKGISNGTEVIVNKYSCRALSTKIDISKKGWLWLGDSVTMGIGIEADSTFAGYIQSKIDSLHIYNASLIGYSIADYYNVFKYFIMDNQNKLDIKHVSLFWCLNDVYNDVKSIEQPGGNLRSYFKNILIWFRTHSRLYLYLKGALFDRPKSYYLFDQNFYYHDNEDFIKAIEILRQINEESTNKGITFTIVLLPYEYQVRIKDNSPQQLMASFFKESNIQFIDLYGHFLEGANVNDYYLFGDGIHFSKRGHKFIANILPKNLP